MLLDEIMSAAKSERTGPPTFRWAIVRDDGDVMIHICSWRKLLVYLTEIEGRGVIDNPVAVVRLAPVKRS